MTQYKLFMIVDPPTQEDVDATTAVLAAYEFPWRWTVARNVRETGKPLLPIGYGDKPSSWGYYNPNMNSINVDPISTSGAARFGQTLAHELGHLIDDTCLTWETRVAIHKLFHADSHVAYEDCATHPDNQSGNPTTKYEWSGGAPHSQKASEAFANLAPQLWCPLHAKHIDGYGIHKYSRKDEIKELVMADAEQNYPFNDIEGSVHEEAILWAVENGLVTGYKDGTFRPQEGVTRGQLASIMKRFKEQL